MTAGAKISVSVVDPRISVSGVPARIRLSAGTLVRFGDGETVPARRLLPNTVGAPGQIPAVNGAGTAVEYVDANVLGLHVLYHRPMDITADLGLPPGFPLKVGFVEQTNPTENAWYMADGEGGVDVATRHDLLTLENASKVLTVVAAQNIYDTENLPEHWGAVVNLAPFITADDLVAVQGVERFVVATTDGETFYLRPDRVAVETMIGQLLAFTSMDDYLLGPDNPTRQLPVQGIIAVNGHDMDQTGRVTMAPHATRPRVTALANLSDTEDMVVDNFPDDGTPFESTLRPWNQAIIFPNQADWTRWNFLPVIRPNQTGFMVISDDDGENWKLVPAGTRTFSRATGGDPTFTVLNGITDVCLVDCPVAVAVEFPDPDIDTEEWDQLVGRLIWFGCSGDDTLTVLGATFSDGEWAAVYATPDVGWQILAQPGAGSGTGDVVGPASATDGRPALFDGTTGKLLKVGATNTANGLVKLNGDGVVPPILIDDTIARDTEVTAAIAAIPSGAAAGTPSLRALGTTGTTAAAGNDSRLSDARTPTPHASSHVAAGSDPVTLAQSQVTNLVTDLAAKVPATRTIAGLDLSADRTAAAIKSALAIGQSDISGMTYSPFFGDGSDGDVVISANTTLTRPMFYRNLTVNSGVTLTTDGFLVMASGTLTLNGTISSVGVGTTGAPPNSTVNRVGVGGGNGGTASGGASVAGSAIGGGAQRRGGTGGTGGNGASAGAAGGSTSACADSVLRTGYLGFDTMQANSGSRIGGGTGGGSGGPAAGAAGGNGGGGGGCVGVFARHCAGTGTVRADGAAGANAANANTGGGGGGGGGFTYVVTSDTTCGWTITANGGSGGTGNGTGTNGAAGGAGTVITLLGAA